MTRGRFHTRVQPTQGDPWGMSDEEPPGPSTLPVRIVSWSQDGAGQPLVSIENDRGDRWSEIYVGTEPGQVSTPSGLRGDDEQAGLEVLRDVLSGTQAGPKTRLMARAVRAGLTGNKSRQVATALVDAIRSGQNDNATALAVLALGFVIQGSGEWDRA